MITAAFLGEFFTMLIMHRCCMFLTIETCDHLRTCHCVTAISLEVASTVFLSLVKMQLLIHDRNGV